MTNYMDKSQQSILEKDAVDSDSLSEKQWRASSVRLVLG